MRRYPAYQDDYGDWFVNVTEEAAAEFVSYESALAYAEEQARKARREALEEAIAQVREYCAEGELATVLHNEEFTTGFNKAIRASERPLVMRIRDLMDSDTRRDGE